MEVILDTCVLVDIFLESRDRHEIGKKLGVLLQKKCCKIKVPMHVMFELSCTLKNIKQNDFKNSSMPYSQEYTEQSGFKIFPVPIDEAFFESYLNVELPYIKAGDFIFLCMAKKDNSILITEDKKLLKKAKDVNVEVYNINEFINKYS